MVLLIGRNHGNVLVSYSGWVYGVKTISHAPGFILAAGVGVVTETMVM